MPTHTWSSLNDWQYCTFIDTKITPDNTIILDNSTTGSIISDIRDSTSRIYDYEEIVTSINIPTGASALFYVRSGWCDEYDSTAWTDWKLINEPEQRIEYTLSLSTKKIIVDYSVKTIENIYYGNDYAFQTLAANLKAIYLDSLQNIDPNDERFSSLWSGVVDDAIVDFARVDNTGESLTIYATDVSTIDNNIILRNALPGDNVVVIVKYTPRHFVYSGHRNRYFQFKIDLTVEPMYLHTITNDEFYTSDNEPINLGMVGPTITSVNVNYKLDFQNEMERAFPRFFRRI